MSSFCRWRIEPSKRITNKLIVINIPKDGCSWRLNNVCNCCESISNIQYDVTTTMLLKNVEKVSSAVQYKCHPLSLKIVLVFSLLLISCHFQYNRKYPICGKLTD
ncbi:hypothetical protein T4B_14167 [Trichinella pseudospiralis]|uniref:Uncharacterized protein n=1 Tax=Trichinella pseudospiralis TaxID=6337 RepID=A0A0V1IB12_TRIPS|nr:hypothetical protein T4B_14167 [Trichinella pseudospiralis]